MELNTYDNEVKFIKSMFNNIINRPLTDEEKLEFNIRKKLYFALQVLYEDACSSLNNMKRYDSYRQEFKDLLNSKK